MATEPTMPPQWPVLCDADILSALDDGFGSDMGSYSGLIAGSAAAAPGVSSKNASFCKENTLDPTLIRGKIVVCEIESIADD
ncbi:hypothetical protein Acr_28g0010300 [Actinidia rufa]|uniref:Uncharacterized protein n=1 Tax=Actinidia rufa TaxID=165716 RepID=A0A7J0HBH5_9ERIC|nr:hypothetical protein Acr_28g0010300 [Actinidia rufa]